MGVSNPQVVDLNNDGIKDLIHGGGNGPASLYYGKSDGTFESQGAVQVTGKDLNPAYYTFFEVTDWNEDGLWDLIAFGTFPRTPGYKEIYALYLNEGTKDQYLFNAETLIDCPDRLPATRNCPAIVDFDYDGKKDFLNGTSEGRGIEFFKNKGTNKAPVVAWDDKLVLENDGGDTWTEVGMEAKIDVADLNGDGKWDIIVGGAGGNKPKPEPYVYISYGYGGGSITAVEKQYALASNDFAKNITVGSVKGEYCVKNSSGKDVTISMYNVKGALVLSERSLRVNHSISLGHLSGNNVYILQMTAGGQTANRRIITNAR